MVRLFAIFCLVCLASAVALMGLPDPWDEADLRAARDATKLADLMDSPDRLSWRITEDVALLRAIVWDADGVRRYPPPDQMAPVVYEFSEEVIRELTVIQTQTNAATWAPFDLANRALLNCRPVPAVCLIYDRALLEEALGLRPGTLSTRRDWRVASLALAAIACLLGGALFWRRRRLKAPGSDKPPPSFHLDPDRHIAIRDTLEVALTPRDLKLLSTMKDRNGAVVTKDELYDAGWGRDYMPNSRALDQHIINLRRKLDPDKSRPVLIQTVHGVGYRLVV